MAPRDKFGGRSIISSFFFCGYFPAAPGTFCSLIVSLLCSAPLLLPEAPPYLVTAAVLLFSLAAGFPAVAGALKDSGEKDPGWIVVDEAAGQSLALLLVAQKPLDLALAFAAFRLFDVWKPFPVRNLEKLNGAAGVMLDDVAAGALAGALVRIIMGLA